MILVNGWPGLYEILRRNGCINNIESAMPNRVCQFICTIKVRKIIEMPMQAIIPRCHGLKVLNPPHDEFTHVICTTIRNRPR